MARDNIDVYQIGSTPEELQSALISLREDFDAHIHDGTSSRSFQTLNANTLNAQTILVHKTSYGSPTAGIWMGFVGGVFQMAIGTATNYLNWDGSTLNIGGSFQTAPSGQRIVLSGSDNTLRFFDATGQVVAMGISNSPQAGIVMGLNSSTNNGVFISSSVAGVGFYYQNTANVAGRGIFIQQTNTGAGTTNPAIEISYAGVYYGELITSSTTAGGMLISLSGTGSGLVIINSGTGNSISISDLSTSGATPAIDINYTRSGQAINLTVSHSGGNPTGIKFNITNGSGNSYAMEFAGGEIVSAAVTGTNNRKIRVLLPGGSVYFIPLYDA